MDLSHGTEKQYLDNVLRLVNIASSFLDSLRTESLLYLSSGSKSRIDKMVSLSESAELNSVSDISSDFETLNKELENLARKFQIIRNSYKSDESLTEFLGDFQKDPTGCYKKLKSFINGSLNQIDTVVASYAAIERSKKPAKNWARTILSHHSSESVTNKAREANQIIKSIETLIEDVRGVCQDTKVDLLDLRSDVAKFAKAGAQKSKGEPVSSKASNYTRRHSSGEEEEEPTLKEATKSKEKFEQQL